MNDPRIPIPLQAVLVTFPAAMIAAAAHLLWFLLHDIEAASRWSWGVPVLAAVVSVVVLRRFLLKVSTVGMIEPQRSPRLTAVLTTLAGASLWLDLSSLSSDTGHRTILNRNSVGLDAALPALIIWVVACCALYLDRRRRNAPDSTPS